MWSSVACNRGGVFLPECRALFLPPALLYRASRALRDEPARLALLYQIAQAQAICAKLVCVSSRCRQKSSVITPAHILRTTVHGRVYCYGVTSHSHVLVEG
jgi:hypothetical protein